MKPFTYGCSIKGIDHYYRGIECQDSNSYESSDNKDDFHIMCVSDGHGSRPYFRSKRGSVFAVNIAKRVIKNFLNNNKKLLDLYENLDDIHSNEFDIDFNNVKETLSKLENNKINLENELNDMAVVIDYYDNYSENDLDRKKFNKLLTVSQQMLYSEFLKDIESFDKKEEFIEEQIDEINKNIENTNKELKNLENSPKHIDKLKIIDLYTEFKNLPGIILEEWKKNVENDLNSNPANLIKLNITLVNSFDNNKTHTFNSFAELDKSKIKLINFDSTGMNYENDIYDFSKNPYLMYGATLIVFANYKKHNFAIQIGDGNITLIDKDNKEIKVFKEDENKSPETTNSLCQKSALKYFNTKYICSDLKFAMLSTDGIFNSTTSPLTNICEEISSTLVEEETPSEDAKYFMEQFKPYLRRFSEGSGDDCTIQFVNFNTKDEIVDEFIKLNESDDINDLDKNYKPVLKNMISKTDFYPIKLEKGNLKKLKSISKDILKKRLSADDENMYNKLAKLGRTILKSRDLIETIENYYVDDLNRFIKENSFILSAFEITKLQFNNDEIKIIKDGVKYILIKKIENEEIEYIEIDEKRYKELQAIYKYFVLDGEEKIGKSHVLIFDNNKIKSIVQN